MDAKDIKDLLRFVRDAGFQEFELEDEGLRLKVVKDRPAPVNGAPAAPVVYQAAAPPAAAGTVAVAPAALPAPPAVPAPAAPAPAPAPVHDPSVHDQTSPMVGTFYGASRPGAAPFVKVGDRVQPGQVLCIIEAMKLMNEIEAEVAGVVVEVVPENAQPVEYGEVLFRIKKD